MWRTQYGDRILEGAEAKVFAEVLLNLLDEVTLCDFDDYELGILWDVDYEDAQLYIDFSPEKSKRLRNWAGIPDNYFLAIADELTDEEAQARIKELRKLCNSVIKAS